MIVLQGPYPAVNTTIVLPNPTFGDTKSNNIALAEKLGIDGTQFTYIKRPGLTTLSYAFTMDLIKSYELINFHAVYKDGRMLLTVDDELWDVRCLTNPLEFTNNSGDLVDTSLSFIGRKISA